ncbi:hypothetical protein [Streptomyces sp. NPDC055607]
MELSATRPRIGEVPFDSLRKRMTTLRSAGEDRVLVCLKGASEAVLLFAYATRPGTDAEPAVRALLTAEATHRQYTHGVKDTTLVRPDTWTHYQALLDRPGNQEIQLALFRDYKNNLDAYPAFQDYFRATRVPLLAVWGRNDEILGPDGAEAYRRDLPDTEIPLLATGRFALEDHLDTITGYVRGFLGRVLN